MRSQPHVLIVAGSDSSGGVGIARDVATVSHFGVRASLAITAVTAQMHDAVIAVEVMPASVVAAQIRAALAANPIAAIKIGMLSTAEVVQAVADVLAGHKAIPVILDPVLASSSGARLLSDVGVECLRRTLLSRATLLTPNLPELGVLAGGATARSVADIGAQAIRLLDHGSSKVLVKGGHARSPQSIDTLYSKGASPRQFASTRHGVALRGTGCMLSSAVAAHLALGHGMVAAISHAKAFMGEAFDAKRLAQEVQSDVERWRAVGAPADRNEIHSG